MDARAAPQLDFDANKVRAFIAGYLGIDAERVTDEAHFKNDFGLDLLDQLELLILIEEEFSGVEFSNDAVDGIEVVGDLIRYIEITCLLGDLYAQAFSSSAALPLKPHLCRCKLKNVPSEKCGIGEQASTDQGGGKRRTFVMARPLG